MAKHNIRYLTGSVGWESQHSWVPLALGPSQSCNQGVSWDCSHLKGKGMGKDLFQAHSQACWQDLVPCWHLARWHPQFLAP